MPQLLSIQTDPFTAADPKKLKAFLLQEGLPDTSDFKIIKRSVDARSRFIKVNLSIEVLDAGQNANSLPALPEALIPAPPNGKSIHIIGSGPSGLFAALKCLHLGYTPVVIERGKMVRERRRDLAAITRQHLVNADSNYCFGEGGAGTYSDGKLYTRSGSRQEVEEVLNTFVYFGASPDILVETHPHIGTNKLPAIIENMRRFILEHGGIVLFGKRLMHLNLKAGSVQEILLKDTATGEEGTLRVDKLILATGHSAGDVYTMLQSLRIAQEFKPFALGFRVEHPQTLIDSLQYRCSASHLQKLRTVLPAASYSMTTQVDGRGVYSFCMCPGGIIAPCSTHQDEVVTNGWSPSKRDNPFANAGWVTEIGVHELAGKMRDPLAGLDYRTEIEQRAQHLAGGTQCAPAQKLSDFLKRKLSSDLLPVSYLPGVKPVAMDDVLPGDIAMRIRKGLKQVIQQRAAFFSDESMIVAPETRTSTPVRIPRDKIKLNHPEVVNLFPCGEGAGYAGGIASAAMDGMRVACACAER